MEHKLCIADTLIELIAKTKGDGIRSRSVHISGQISRAERLNYPLRPKEISLLRAITKNWKTRSSIETPCSKQGKTFGTFMFRSSAPMRSSGVDTKSASKGCAKIYENHLSDTLTALLESECSLYNKPLWQSILMHRILVRFRVSRC